jgi:hypothetical protein
MKDWGSTRQTCEPKPAAQVACQGREDQVSSTARSRGSDLQIPAVLVPVGQHPALPSAIYEMNMARRPVGVPMDHARASAAPERLLNGGGRHIHDLGRLDLLRALAHARPRCISAWRSHRGCKEHALAPSAAQHGQAW